MIKRGEAVRCVLEYIILGLMVYKLLGVEVVLRYGVVQFTFSIDQTCRHAGSLFSLLQYVYA